MAGKSHSGTIELFWLPMAAIDRVFRVQPNMLESRGVKKRQGDERLEYELADFWANCRDLVYKRLSEGVDGDEADLKLAKLREEVRKLQIDNDARDAILVPSADVEAAFSRSIKAMADELDATVSRVKMACPDIPQAALAVLKEQLDASRRKASRLDFKGLGNAG